MVRALLLAVLLAGCASTQPAPLSSPEGRAEVNARAEGRVAFVHVEGERRHEGRSLRVGPDTTTWVDRLTGEPRSAPTAALSSVAVLRGETGVRVLKGAAIGTITGGLLGVLLGATDGDGWFSFDPAPAGALGALGGSFYGGLAGLVTGHRDVYRPAPPETAAACGGPPLACAAPLRVGGGVGRPRRRPR